MPVTEANIMGAFADLIDAGTRLHGSWQGPTDVVGMRKTAKVWVKTLSTIDKPGLDAGIVAYLSGPKSDWFPTPGAILQLVPSKLVQMAAPAPIESNPYNDLDDFGRQQVLNQADREGWWFLDLAECWRRIDAAALAQPRAVLAFAGVNAR